MGGSSAQWLLAMYVNLAPRADNNLVNHSPTSSLSLVIYVPIAVNTSISVPMSDEDGDILRCRFAQSSKNMSGIIVNECSGGCSSTALPSSTQLFASDNNCTLIVSL
ncbi:unnamed protein product [Rotaria sordida]|uniref:Uncharacterized protein n=2 Tax=Rotaria sordida TaxID=392033 RepID=A0A815M324_9BILA|nr:unnamed protein product [Rotaria sordida]